MKKWMILSIISLFSLPVIFAFSGESTNYKLNATIGLVGNKGSSASYEVRYTMCDQPVGEFLGTNYNLCLGGHYYLNPPSYLNPPLADMNADCEVNINDFIILGNAYGCNQDQECYDSRADLKKDGRVNAFDFNIFGRNFGKTCLIKCGG